MSINAIAESLNYEKYWQEPKRQEILDSIISLIFKSNTSKKKLP